MKSFDHDEANLSETKITIFPFIYLFFFPSVSLFVRLCFSFFARQTNKASEKKGQENSLHLLQCSGMDACMCARWCSVGTDWAAAICHRMAENYHCVSSSAFCMHFILDCSLYSLFLLVSCVQLNSLTIFAAIIFLISLIVSHYEPPLNVYVNSSNKGTHQPIRFAHVMYIFWTQQHRQLWMSISQSEKSFVCSELHCLFPVSACPACCSPFGFGLAIFTTAAMHFVFIALQNSFHWLISWNCSTTLPFALSSSLVRLTFRPRLN